MTTGAVDEDAEIHGPEAEEAGRDGELVHADDGEGHCERNGEGDHDARADIAEQEKSTTMTSTAPVTRLWRTVSITLPMSSVLSYTIVTSTSSGKGLGGDLDARPQGVGDCGCSLPSA